MSRRRYFEELFYLPRSVALRVSAATPKRFAGVSAFLGDTLEHGLAAFWAERCVCLYAFLPPMVEALGGESFSKAAFLRKGPQVSFELFVEHRNEALAKVKEAPCGSNGVVGIEPGVEFVLLCEDMQGTLIRNIVCIGCLVELYCLDFLVFWVMN